MGNKTTIKKNPTKTTQHFQMCSFVNLTFTAEKLGQNIIRNVIGVDVNKCTLPWKSQHGFCKGNYCLENLLEVFERVSRHMDKVDMIDIIYLDLDIKQPSIRGKKVIT